jgi:hypothetical protein
LKVEGRQVNSPPRRQERQARRLRETNFHFQIYFEMNVGDVVSDRSLGDLGALAVKIVARQ